MFNNVRPPLILLIGFLFSFLMLIQASPAAAASFTVDNAGDAGDTNTSDGVCDINAAPVNPGDCTLRAAIQQANALSGGDTITVSVSGPINTASELTVVSNITINGGGVTVNNTGSGRVFGVAFGTLTLSNITVTGGSADNGGGIGVAIGVVNLNTGANVTGNNAVNGGGVYVYFGTLRINGGTLTGNNASGRGGGVYLTAGSGLNASGALIASNIASNGGGIFQDSGSTTVTGSSIVCNSDSAVAYSGGTMPMNVGGNWWGSAYGPYYSNSTQGLQCSTSDSLNSANPLANYGITITTSSSGSCNTAPVGNWLTASPVSGTPPISSVSALSPNRVCPRS